MALPINIKDLILGKAVESDRIEYKEGWNPGPIYRSICAFANDFDDIGGGYIIVGIEEENGRPVLPPKGISEEGLDTIQREMLGLNNLINPWNYPYQALEEIIANALYHRDYQTREPVEIRIYQDKIRFINYGGPDRSIKLMEFGKGTVIPRRYGNRRLGDFLKELDLAEGKATGIPTIIKAMEVNGSPKAEFDTDEDRSFFHVVLPIHNAFLLSTKVRRSKTNVFNKTSLSSQEIREQFRENALKIILLIKEDEKITAAELAQKIDISSRAVQKNIAKMQENGVLHREGSRKTGKWEVLLPIEE